MSSELTTCYLGLELSSPVIVGSCPLTIEPEQVRQMVEAGAGAIVLPSLLQEQIVHAQMKSCDPIAAIDRSGYQPQQDKYNGGVERYLETIRNLKATHHVPIFASLNGGTSGDWIDFAKRIQSTGADGLEFNWQSVIADPDESAEQVESRLCEIVKRLCETVSIPVAVKLSQRYTSLASIANKVQSAGAAGVVLFTHLPHWDVSIDRMHWTIRWELSPIDSFGGILEGLVRTRGAGLDISIAASGGIRSSEDAIKAMIAGADAVMVTSEIYRTGPDTIRKMIDGIRWFLTTSSHTSLLEFQNARPAGERSPQRIMRFDYVDPLTQPDHYIDPTPVPGRGVGDAYGHKLS